MLFRPDVICISFKYYTCKLYGIKGKTWLFIVLIICACFFTKIKNILLLGTSSTMQGISTLESQLGMSKPDSPRQIIDAPGGHHGNHAAGQSM